jgi:hypothetical protein
MSQKLDRIRARLAASAEKQCELLRAFHELLESPEASAAAIDRVERRLRRMTADHTRLLTEWRLMKARVAQSSFAYSSPDNRLVGQRPMREQVLDILEELGVPASPRLISEIAVAHYGRPLPASRFASLRRDEERAYRKDALSRPAWVVPALSAQGLTSIPRIVATSAWSSERRLIGARTLRANHLRTVLVLLSIQERTRQASNPGATAHLDAMILAFAQTVPRAVEPGQQIEPLRIREAAKAELALIDEMDLDERRTAAHRLANLQQLHQLWGRPALIEVQEVAGRS